MKNVLVQKLAKSSSAERKTGLLKPVLRNQFLENRF